MTQRIKVTVTFAINVPDDIDVPKVGDLINPDSDLGELVESVIEEGDGITSAWTVAEVRALDDEELAVQMRQDGATYDEIALALGLDGENRRAQVLRMLSKNDVD